MFPFDHITAIKATTNFQTTSEYFEQSCIHFLFRYCPKILIPEEPNIIFLFKMISLQFYLSNRFL